MNHIIPTCNMPFAEYIELSRILIRQKRALQNEDYLKKAVEVNSPYEMKSDNFNLSRTIGLLFVHGLLDSPFTWYEIAKSCAENNILCRSILLPGHGTEPADLNYVTYQDWIKTVNYGVQSLHKVVNKIVLMGYSMGGMLSLYHALNNENITGLVLIAPAIKIKFPADPLVHLVPYLKGFGKTQYWVKKAKEIDYAKYRSIPFNAIQQLNQLIKLVGRTRKLHCPVFITVSQQDETVSAKAAIDFFKNNSHAASKLLIYTPRPHPEQDSRIIQRNSFLPDSYINHFSHRSLTFSAANPHYGHTGDYPYASHKDKHQYYGAYISFLGTYYALLERMSLCKIPRKELTYNPDFNFLSQQINSFIAEIAR